jgi:hypothetical protein
VFVSLATALDNVHQNTLLHYFMVHSVFDPLLGVRLAVPLGFAQASG